MWFATWRGVDVAVAEDSTVVFNEAVSLSVRIRALEANQGIVHRKLHYLLRHKKSQRTNFGRHSTRVSYLSRPYSKQTAPWKRERRRAPSRIPLVDRASLGLI
jgi:hypothetical protein